MAGGGRKEATSASGIRRRAEEAGGAEFRDLDALDIVGIYPDYKSRAGRLESQGAGDRGQCAYALFHRSSAPAARTRTTRPARVDRWTEATKRPAHAHGRRQKRRRDGPLQGLLALDPRAAGAVALCSRTCWPACSPMRPAGPPDQPAGRRIGAICDAATYDKHLARHHRALARPAFADAGLLSARRAAGRDGVAQRRCRTERAGDRKDRLRSGARLRRAGNLESSRQGRRARARSP